MATDFYVGEHGDLLTVTMPFDATGDSIVIEVQKPGPGAAEVNWTGGFTITATTVSRTVLPGELDVVGEYHCAVIATTASPARVRKVKFSLRVADATPR